MILVDSSVWIDYFKGARNSQTDRLDALLAGADEELGVADLVVFEVLRGFSAPKTKDHAQALLLTTRVVEIGGLDNALLAAEHYSALRAQGCTVRSPVDLLLASYCIRHGHILLHRDADFDVIAALRGLQVMPH